jgi:hypothetical protein
MKLFRVLLVVLCVAVTGLVAAGPANAVPTPLQPPTVTTFFTPSSIPLNGTANWSVGVSNPNPAGSLTGVNVADTMPAGLVITNPFAGAFCGGTFTVTATSITMTGLTLAPGDVCSVGGVVQGTTLGTKVNTATVTSTNGGTGAPATATLVVAHQPPTFTKAFGAATIPVGGTTTLTFTLVNPNPSISLGGIVFTDPLPLGLRIGAPNGLVNTCGGIAQAVAGSGALSLSGVSLSPSGTCTLQVNVQATSSSGVKNNQTTPVTSNEAGLGNRATASITVTP